MHSHGGLLEPRGSKLALLKSTFNAEISFPGCLGLFPVISTQFTLEMCVAATNREKITKNSYDAGTLGKLVISACYDVQQGCVYLQPFSC